MKNFAFISRHIPTEDQINLAESQGIRLITIGDMNAFTIDTNSIMELGVENETPFDGVIVVHPAAALRLAGDFLVGVFENSNRAPVGQPPQFEAVSLHIFDLRN